MQFRLKSQVLGLFFLLNLTLATTSPEAVLSTGNNKLTAPTPVTKNVSTNISAKYDFNKKTPATQKEPLTIEADYVKYLEENEYVRATGNVLLVYKDVHLTANVTTINMKTDQLYISDGFVFNRANQKISGETLFYDVSEQTGYATKVNLLFYDKIIKGKNVTIDKEKIIVDDSWESTCVKDPACNHITSKRTTIYPEWGDIVHDHAVVYVYVIPVMYVPNYVSNTRVGATDLMYSAIPKFGSNPVEGNFAKAGISYYTNEKLNGTVDIHYLSKLGFRYGFTNNYKLSQDSYGQIRLHYLTGLGGRTSYGWMQSFLLGVPYKTKKEIIDDFFRGVMPPSKQNYPEFTIEVTDRELYYVQWLSYRPKLTLYSPHYEIMNSGLFNYLSGYVANIEEEDAENVPSVEAEGSRTFVKGYWDYNIYKTIGLAEYGRLVPSITYMKTGYYEGNDLRGAWKRFYYNLNYYKDWWKFNFHLGYKNTFEESGYSPFKFDTFNISTPEEYSYNLGYQILDYLKLSYFQFYSITGHRVRDKGYAATLKACCWDIVISWWDSTSQFTFNISLQ